MEKCQRCNGEEAMFACMQCESFRLLCERCDNYIHGLPGKKGHNRVAMTPQGEKSLRDKQNNNKSCRWGSDNKYGNFKSNRYGDFNRNFNNFNSISGLNTGKNCR